MPIRGVVRGVVTGGMVRGVVGGAGGPPPVNLAAPALVLPSGAEAPQVGVALAIEPGAWQGEDEGMARTYQIYRDGVAIPGATDPESYTPTEDDIGALLTVREVASNAYGSTAAMSAAVGPVEPPFAGILDQLSTVPFAAYSLRLLTVDYEGPAIRVRESSGNTEADIGFDGDGNLDTAALLAHCGSNDGFITVWYDQVGSADLKQTTAGAQPRIVSAGTVDTKNSVPMARMLGTVPNGTRFMLTDAFTAYTGTTLAAAVAVSLDASQGFYRRILGAWNGTNDTGATAAILAMANNGSPATGYATYRNGGERSNVAGDIGGVNVVWSDYDGSNGQIATEAAAGSAGASTGAFSVVRFILSSDSASSASFSMVGYVGEMIVFTTLPSGGDETTLRDDMATFYGA